MGGRYRGIWLLILLLCFLSAAVCAVNYYVDSSTGSDSNTCIQAQNTATPKKTVNGVMSCTLTAGDIVKFRGNFTQSLEPGVSGQVLFPTDYPTHSVEDIVQVNDSTVTFNTDIGNLGLNINPQTDWVTIYNSRKGNSGAFPVVSVSGNNVTVNTSSLPGGKFLLETANDPHFGIEHVQRLTPNTSHIEFQATYDISLQAAILRPIHFTAWDINNPPVWDTGKEVTYISVGSVIMVSHLKFVTGKNGLIYPALSIGGYTSTVIDFNIIDHMDISNAGSAINTGNQNQSDYNIIQYNDFHDMGYMDPTNSTAYPQTDFAVLYLGHWGHWDYHHDFFQVMYNRVGPHQSLVNYGDGIDFKHSCHAFTVFGNEVYGLHPNACGDGPITTEGQYGYIANNYVHDIVPKVSQGCGIGMHDLETPSGSQYQGQYPVPIDIDPANEDVSGAKSIIVANNIIANVPDVSISVGDASDIQIYNNIIYNNVSIDCTGGCDEQRMGIRIDNYMGPTTGIVIKNNLVQGTYIGIGRYIWSANYPYSIDSDYNIVYNNTYPFRGAVTQNTHDKIADPKLVNPLSSNFALDSTSPAIDAGTDLTSVFNIDQHNAASPAWPITIAPTIRTGQWDIGAFESNYTSGIDYTSPSVTLNSPADTSSTALLPINFKCLVSDNIHVQNVTLFGNWSSGWKANETNSSGYNNSLYNFTKTIQDGRYAWNCYACDNSSNCAFAASNRTFRVDTTPPIISNVQNISITDHSVVITWTTDELSDSAISFGITSSSDNISSNVSFTQNHQIILSGLTNNNLYYYNVTSCDPFGNCRQNGCYNFTTLNTCIESWSCSGWSSCTNKVQTRTCIDANDCGTIVNMPTLSESCSSPTVGSYSSGGGGGYFVPVNTSRNISKNIIVSHNNQSENIQNISENTENSSAISQNISEFETSNNSKKEKIKTSNNIIPIVPIFILSGLVAFIAIIFVLHHLTTIPASKVIEVKNYIAKARTAGLTSDQIKSKLIKVGWSQKIIDKLLKS